MRVVYSLDENDIRPGVSDEVRFFNKLFGIYA